MDYDLVPLVLAIALLAAYAGYQSGKQTYHGVLGAKHASEKVKRRNRWWSISKQIPPAMLPAYSAMKAVLLLGGCLYCYWTYNQLQLLGWKSIGSMVQPVGPAVAVVAFVAWFAASYRADPFIHTWPIAILLLVGVITYYPVLLLPSLAIAVGVWICTRVGRVRFARRKRSTLQLVQGGRRAS